MNSKSIYYFVANELVYGGHILSVGSASIVYTISVLLNTDINLSFLLIVYFITYIAYSYNKLLEIKKDLLTNPSRAQYVAKSAKKLPFFLLFSFLIIVFLLLKFGNFSSIILVMLMIFGSLLYTLYFKKFTRRITGFKSFYVAFFWSSLVILFSFYFNKPFDLTFCLLFIFVFIRWIINTSFCDFKDVAGDKKEDLKTFAVVFGENRWLKYLMVLNLLSVLPILYGIYNNIFPFYSIFILLVVLYDFYYFYEFKNSRWSINFISDVLADSEFIFWSFFIIIGKAIL